MQQQSESDPRSVEQLVKPGRTIAMVSTITAGEITSRPVTCVEVVGDRIEFLVSRSSDWVQAIERGGTIVHVTIADDSHDVYLDLRGDAALLHDSDERARLWSPIAKAWFSGPDDPDLAVLRFEAQDGEYWSGPSTKVGRVVQLVRAAATGDQTKAGDRGRIR